MASSPQPKKPRSISLRLPKSVALTTEPFQSEEGAFACLNAICDFGQEYTMYGPFFPKICFLRN